MQSDVAVVLAAYKECALRYEALAAAVAARFAAQPPPPQPPGALQATRLAPSIPALLPPAVVPESAPLPDPAAPGPAPPAAVPPVQARLSLPSPLHPALGLMASACGTSPGCGSNAASGVQGGDHVAGAGVGGGGALPPSRPVAHGAARRCRGGRSGPGLRAALLRGSSRRRRIPAVHHWPAAGHPRC